MRLIVGLGNPGLKYKLTRHNLGFLVADRFSKDVSIRFRRRENNALLGRGRIGGEEIILMKPLTYMNLSGPAVASVIAKEGLSLERVMVVCDDVNLELGVLRLRPKGSAGGHRGLQSIIEELENEGFPRLRVGVGRTVKQNLSGHVLGPFKKADLSIVNKATDKAVQALDCWINDGIEAAMNAFNA